MSAFIHTATKEPAPLFFGQSDIWPGLSGMAVGANDVSPFERELVTDGLLVYGPQGKIVLVFIKKS